jgi:hypothetical protein
MTSRTPSMSPLTSFFVAPSYPFYVAPSAFFLSPRAEARGPSAPACLGRTKWGGALLSLGTTGWRMSPRAPFFCRPEPQGEGSLGTCVPRPDKVGGCRPEGSARGVSSFYRPLEIEACLSTSRQERAENFIEIISEVIKKPSRLANSSDIV